MDAPELPFRETPDKRPKLVIALRGKRTGHVAAFFNLVCEEVVLDGRVKLGLEEGEEEVEQVNGMSVYSSVS